uniref:C2H2-type domain-containing protein n=1 Tax=Parastrongyloides trichosuri TaxID=131310 RepID=A0A0N4ZLY1_PARTI
MSLTNTSDTITTSSATIASINSAFQNISNIEGSNSEGNTQNIKIGSNKSAFTTIFNPYIDNASQNHIVESMEVDIDNMDRKRKHKEFNKPGNIELTKILPPRICEQGPSDPSSPVDQYHNEYNNKNDSPFLTVDAMQRINLLSPSYAIDINKLCPNYQNNYATSDLGSSTRSSFSVSPTTVQLNPLFANFRESKRSTDYETDSDYGCKDLLSPYSALSPSPFNSSEPYPELPETPYSGFVSSDGRSPAFSPLPFNSSTLSLHFNFDNQQQQRSTSSLSTSRCHDEISTSQHLFTNLLMPNSLTNISRERSRSEGEMLAESINAVNESHILSTLCLPVNQHKNRSKIAASNNIKKEHRIRNCYSPQSYHLDRPIPMTKNEDSHRRRNKNSDKINNELLLTNRSSSTPPPTIKESATIDAALLAKEALNIENSSNFALSSKSALNLNTLDKNLSQINFNNNNIPSTNNWLEAQLEVLNRAFSVNSLPPTITQSFNIIPQQESFISTSQFLNPPMGNYSSQLHSENDLSNTKKINSHPISQKNDISSNKQGNDIVKIFPDSTSNTTTTPITTSSTIITNPSITRLTPTKTSLIPPIGAIPISCVNEAYVCPVCGQAFALADRLAKHIASRHKDPNIDPITVEANKIHKCEQCGKKFGRSDMLTRHLRLHTGVKPYSCNVCGQVFSRSDHLSTHQRTHTGEKPYQCPQCNYAASRRDMITRHLRIHTKNEETMTTEMMSKISISQQSTDKEQLNIKTTLDVPTISLSSPMDTTDTNSNTEENFKNKAKIIFKSNEG